MSQTYLGIDTGKKKLHLGTSKKALREFPNTNEGHQSVILYASKCDDPHVVVEASGGYEQALVDALHDANIKVSVVQPGCVRHFAKSLRVLAKTDAIDATVIARFAEATKPDLTERTPDSVRRLRALSDRRTQLVEDRTRESNRLGVCTHPDIAKEINRQIKRLTALIEKIEQQILEHTQQQQDLAAKSDAMQAAVGVGLKTAAVLLAHLPELGSLTRATAAALAGLAPHPRESGAWKGKRRIYGGRKAVRTALFMAAKSAARHCPVLAPFHERLKAANKPYKVTIIAVARKLLVRLNTILKNLPNPTPNATLAT